MKTTSIFFLCAASITTAFAQDTTAAPPQERSVSLRTIVPNIGEDQKRIWRSPAELRHKRTWIPLAAVLGTAAALIATDPHDTAWFRRTSDFSGFNKVMTSNHTAAGIIAAPAALFAIGTIAHNRKATGTALLTAEAVADSWVVGTVLKDAFMRARPSQILPNGNFSDSWFEHRTSFINPNGGMPSGHTLYAFAVATIVARRYGNHRWVPFVSYGLATAVALSRVTGSSHFVSDVFVGGVLGYSISRFAVLGQ
ncbi:MAG TPA: phosphatase PAP2 family protein [Bryobacteraceae bacterium]|nr:phosphatase PAP2 family protein [Bryobacteraceae bacterium]